MTFTHYETKEVKDSNGRLILPAGKDVNEDFTLNYSDNGNKVSVSGDFSKKRSIKLGI